MEPKLMNLKILLPFEVFADLTGVKRIVAETPNGSFGLLPHRLDCTASLAPGILIYETDALGEIYIAIDEGILVKVGTQVMVSVRNAIGGVELGSLHKAIEKKFLNIDEQEKNVRQVMAKLEIGFIRRFERFQKK
jgi:F-type H+-transporting ATPase subunit epsilon